MKLGPATPVLVTGGAGFIGTHTVRGLLQRGCRVMVIDDLRHPCGQPVPDQVELVVTELSSQEAGAAIARFRPHAAVHLAAQGGVSRSVRDPAADALVNVVGTVALLKFLADCDCRRLVFASSGGAIYGRSAQLPSSERAAPKPLSPYGAAKLAGEGYLGLFRRSFGLHSVALRYANVYGPFQDGTGEAGVVAITATRLLEGLAPLINGDGEQTRDFVFVEDIARANLMALESDWQGAANIGTGQETSVLEIVSLLSTMAGYNESFEHQPARPGEVRRTYLNVSTADRVLGWRPVEPLASGLAATFASFRDLRRIKDGDSGEASSVGRNTT